MAEWISVTKNLPDEYDYVLISYVDSLNKKLRYVPAVGVRIDGFWSTKESSATLSAKHRDFEKEYNVTVTHWMPLPSPPRD